MMVKVKTLLFGCCNSDPDQNLSTAELEKKLQQAEERRKIARIEHETAETQNNCLTTYEGHDEVGEKQPILKLTAIEGDILGVGKQFTITSKGMEFGGRRHMDGCIQIGRLKLAKNSNVVLNDIVLDDPSVGEKHCEIKYDEAQRQYLIKDQGDGTGTFVKVDGDFKLKSGYIISFGDTHMIVQIANGKNKDGTVPVGSEDLKAAEEPQEEEKGAEKDEKEGMLTVKFLDGPKAGQGMKFKPEEEIVKIGRLNDCQIKFEGSNMSRYQCTMKYINNMWHINDGLDKPSTNGTWIFLDHPYVIHQANVFKIGQTLFKADILN